MMLNRTSENRVLITGGSGFIGTNLVEGLLSLGWNVRNLDIQKPRNDQHNCYWVQGDLRDAKCVLNNVQSFQPHFILHFGARTDLDETKSISGYSANFEGTKHIIDAVRLTPSIKRVIFASSQLVCKLGYRPSHDEDYLPSTLYGESKVRMEKLIRASLINVPWVIVRPTSIWGPWFDVPYKTFFLTIMKNYYMHPGSIKTLKQWGFVGNCVYQIQKLLMAPIEEINQKTFYLADYDPTLLREFADKAQAALGARTIMTVPSSILQLAAWFGDGLQKLGWKNPPMTSFRYHNIITNELQDLKPLQQVVGPLPYTLDQGICITSDWLKKSMENPLR